MAEVLHKKWADYTDKEIHDVVVSRCSKCPYKLVMKSSVNTFGTVCNYFSMTGIRRETRPEFCEHFKDTVEPRKKKANF